MWVLGSPCVRVVCQNYWNDLNQGTATGEHKEKGRMSDQCSNAVHWKHQKLTCFNCMYVTLMARYFFKLYFWDHQDLARICFISMSVLSILVVRKTWSWLPTGTCNLRGPHCSGLSPVNFRDRRGRWGVSYRMIMGIELWSVKSHSCSEQELSRDLQSTMWKWLCPGVCCHCPSCLLSICNCMNSDAGFFKYTIYPGKALLHREWQFPQAWQSQQESGEVW